MTGTERLHAPGCPDAEELALYGEGGLDAGARAIVEAHLAGCSDCRTVLYEAMAVAAELDRRAVTPLPAPVQGRRWVWTGVGALAAAATILLVLRVERPQWLDRWIGSEGDYREQLVAALSTEPTRPLEGRLVGFDHAPPSSPRRGSSSAEVGPDVQIAAARVEREAPLDTASGNGAVGVALLIVGEWDAGVVSLEKATNLEPDNAALRSDLSAAYLERGRRLQRADDLARALSTAEAATRLDPQSAPALFNRALALEHLERVDAAIDAWRQYRESESDPRWRHEAEERAAALQSRR